MSGCDVFISYRRGDGRQAAGRLRDWLSPYFGPERVFMDVTAIEGGDPFPDAISEAIQDCRAVVAVVTPLWRAALRDPDGWVHREMREALVAGCRIIPVLVDGSAPLEASELPPDLAELANAEAVAVSELTYRDDAGRLISALKQAGAIEADLVAFPDVPQQGRAESRAGWFAADDVAHARERLVAVLARHKIRVEGEHDSVLMLRGGSKWKSRFLKGTFFDSDSKLSVAGRLRITDRGATVGIEVLLAEDWGPGVFAGLVLDDLRQSTTRARVGI